MPRVLHRPLESHNRKDNEKIKKRATRLDTTSLSKRQSRATRDRLRRKRRCRLAKVSELFFQRGSASIASHKRHVGPCTTVSRPSDVMARLISVSDLKRMLKNTSLQPHDATPAVPSASKKAWESSADWIESHMRRIVYDTIARVWFERRLQVKASDLHEVCKHALPQPPNAAWWANSHMVNERANVTAPEKVTEDCE